MYNQSQNILSMAIMKILQYLCMVCIFVSFSCFTNVSSVFAEVVVSDDLPANVPLFCEEINKDDNNEVLVRFTELMTDEKKSFDAAYFIVKDEYHARINELFAENITKLANNIYQNGGIDEKICAPFKYEKQTQSLQVTREMVKNFRMYECALEKYIAKPPYSENEILLTEGVQRLNTVQMRLQQEIRWSFLALEKTIEMYTELRLWFPVHRDLLCLIEQMKAYRNAVRNFVDQIVRMPAKYYNYGSRYQQ